MSKEITMLNPSALRPHPRNEEFFSNIEGEDFVRLKESIAELGILTPLRVAADLTIVSGHQRYRAAKELGLKTIPVIIDDELEDEDNKIVQLIAANFGRTENLIDKAKWIAEYEKLRGVRQGSFGKVGLDGNNFRLNVSQEDIAKELGITSKTLRNLKKLNDLIPEIQDIISEGRINATTGFKLIASLSPDEQRKLLESLPETEKITAKKMETCIAGMRSEYDKKISDMEIKYKNEAAAIRAEQDQKLVEDKRKYYENWQAALKAKSDIESQLKEVCEQRDKAVESARKANLKAALKESPEGMEQLNSHIFELEAQIETLTAQLDEANSRVEQADQQSKDGFLRYAVPEASDARSEMENIKSLYSRIQTAVGSFLTDVRSLNRESESFSQIPSEIAGVLIDTVSDAISESKLLYGALVMRDDNTDDDDAA